MSRPAMPFHCGVEVLAYVFMSNHYHLLVRVPELVARDALGREVILERIGTLYGSRVRKELLAELDSGIKGWLLLPKVGWSGIGR